MQGRRKSQGRTKPQPDPWKGTTHKAQPWHSPVTPLYFSPASPEPYKLHWALEMPRRWRWAGAGSAQWRAAELTVAVSGKHPVAAPLAITGFHTLHWELSYFRSVSSWEFQFTNTFQIWFSNGSYITFFPNFVPGYNVGCYVYKKSCKLYFLCKIYLHL